MFMKDLNVPLVFLALSKINAWNLSNINDEKPKLKPEAATGGILWKKVFLKVSQNS